MHIADMLFTQGFGTRRACAGLVRQGRVRVGGLVVADAQAEVQATGLHFTVDGQHWQYQAHALVMLHKPAGYECSQKPRHHPSVMSLLPTPLRTRGVQPVGRLDEDTTGLMLLTDDGTLIHRLTSPKHHVPKVYEVTARHTVSDAQIVQLLAGVVLDDSPEPVRALAAERVTPLHLRLTLAEGKYHQVKRMLAAAGNRCDALHRSAFGRLVLPAALGIGQWCWVDAATITAEPAAAVG
ncbi:MAG: pseudouridine synthase [Rubrivivax sp.]|nr:pseudouridine synthase [Rubrivivax sp.]